ncbi:hypothetical protein JXQ31_04035 [candidate division KSB1 bacterium]|nr:hypothetical protein [candidate division KSB1 bacterium]
MPGYNTLPSDWQTELEKKSGVRMMLDLVFDPEDKHIILDGKYGIEYVSGISNILGMDVAWERRPAVKDVIVKLRDPEGGLDPRNPASPFFDAVSEVYENVPSFSAQIKIGHKEGVYYTNGQPITIKGENYNIGGLSEQDNIVTGFTNGQNYDILTLKDTIHYNFASGSILYSNALEGKEVQVRLKLDNTINPIVLFRGRLLKAPEVQSGYITLVLVELKKSNLDLLLTGADNDPEKKLMRINATEELEDTVKWNEGAYGTLDKNFVYPLAACRPGEWKLEFITNTEYIISGPGVDGLRCDKRYGIKGRIAGAENDLGFAWDLVKDLNYIFIPVIDTNKLVILNISDQTAPVKESGISFSESSVYASAAKSTNYVFVAYVYLDEGFHGAVKCFHVADKTNPVLIDTKIAGSEGVPEDFFCYSCKVYGNFLFVQGHNYIYIFNISNPFDISYVTRIGGNGAPNYMQGLWDFDISGQYLFTISYYDKRFIIIDIGNPSNPSLVTTLELEPGGYNVRVSGNYAFVKTVDGRIFTINITNINSPVVENEFGGPCAPNYTGGYGMYIDGNLLYSVNQNYSAMSIIDISDPVNLKLKETIAGAGEPHFLNNPTDLTVYNEYAYITAENGLTIYRLSADVTNNQGGNLLRICPAAWGTHTYTGESVTFVTAVSWVNENPVQILYDLLTQFSKLLEKLINCSSYFGDKKIGFLYAGLEQTDTIVQIAVTIPVVIKSGETLDINGTLVTVTQGNNEQTSYPPLIELTIAAYTGEPHPSGTAVVWKKRTTPDTDYFFDAEYQYCADSNNYVSLSLDRRMSVLQALEIVGAHYDGFLFTDNWGVEGIYTFREHADEPITISGDTNLLPDPVITTKELVNELTIRYGYDYENSKYLNELIHEGPDGVNKSFWRNQFKRSAELFFPAQYTKSRAITVAANKYKLWQNGIKLVSFELNLQGIVLKIGDKVRLVSEHPAIDSVFEIIGRQVSLNDGVKLKFIGYDVSNLWT